MNISTCLAITASLKKIQALSEFKAREVFDSTVFVFLVVSRALSSRYHQYSFHCRDNKWLYWISCNRTRIETLTHNKT